MDIHDDRVGSLSHCKICVSVTPMDRNRSNQPVIYFVCNDTFRHKRIFRLGISPATQCMKLKDYRDEKTKAQGLPIAERYDDRWGPSSQIMSVLLTGAFLEQKAGVQSRFEIACVYKFIRRTGQAPV